MNSIGTLIKAITFGMLLAGILVTESSAIMDSSKDITLTWSGDPMTTQTISWKSNSSVGESTVTYEIAGTTCTPFVKSAPSRKLPQVPGGDAADNNFYSVTLTGLQSGTTYTYSIVPEDLASKPHTFTTESSKIFEFKFLVFGDSQSGKKEILNYQPWRETVHHAFESNPDSKFFMNVGDLVETGQSYAHWESWFEAAKGVIDTIPCMPVLGNHEMYCSNSARDDTKPVYYLSQFMLPLNGPETLKGQVYSFDYGCVHFVVLDSQQDEELPIGGDILDAQRRWLESDLGATHQPWKMVFFHKPPYNNKLGRPNPAVKAAFCPIFDTYHVDVVFNGHEHGLYRTYPIKNDIIQNNPHDGTIYYTTGRSGAKYYNDVGPTAWDAFSYNPNDQPCYETVQVNPMKLVITARKLDGTVIDVCTINK